MRGACVWCVAVCGVLLVSAPARALPSVDPSARTLAAAQEELPGPGPNGLALTPPMGWMSWERFRCETDCTNHPTECINEDLYREMAAHLNEDGYLAVGYNQVSIDDCWASMTRNADGNMEPDPDRFPSGIKALADYVHSHGVKFGIYSDMGTKTCAGYPGSEGFEKQDAQLFASWGVDYLKLDGCNNNQQGYTTGYPLMGTELQATGRNITYSCSWPAYLGYNETAKPFDAMIQAGCNLWRNWRDIDNKWSSLVTIMDHFGNYSEPLQAAAGPGHWNDMDMILVGSDHYNFTLSVNQSQTQMAIWAIMASPLIMSNDLRTVKQEFKAVLQNKEVIAVNQDVGGKAGKRVSAFGQTEVWARDLHDGSVAVVLFNKNAPAARQVTVQFADVGFSPHDMVHARDLFRGMDLGTMQQSLSVVLAPASVLMARLAKAS